MRAILLAAGPGRHLRPLTDDKPACMLGLAGSPLLHWQLQALRASGIDDIVLVRGYSRAAIDAPGTRALDNPGFEHNGTLASLIHARAELRGAVLVAQANLLLRQETVDRLRACAGPLGLAARWPDGRPRSTEPIVHDFDPETREIEFDGQSASFVGAFVTSAAGSERLRNEIDRRLSDEPSITDSDRAMEHFLAGLVRAGMVTKAIGVGDECRRIDTARDLAAARLKVEASRWPAPDPTSHGRSANRSASPRSQRARSSLSTPRM